MSILPIALLQMNVWVLVLITIAVLALLVIVYIAGLNRGVKAGIELGMRYTLNRTLDELRKSADKKGCAQIFEDLIQTTLNTYEMEYLKKQN
jgi:uncharacterized membrane-anchored protein